MKSIFIFGQKHILINYYNAFTALGYEVNVSKDISTAHYFDILCLAGGGDINAFFYGSSCKNCRDIDSVRDLAELELIWRFISRNKPIIGICRGLQVINVYFGGTLLSHIENHSQQNNADQTHKIICLRNGFLHKEFGKEILVNSAHHQAIDVLGDNLVVDSVSLDGTIESIYHKNLPIFAFQFHPERLKTLEILKYALAQFK